MKRTVMTCVIILFFAAPAFAAGDPVKEGMTLYRKHRYADAVRILRTNMASLRADKKAAANLTLGMIYLRSAELYRELYNTSVSVHLDYLKRLSAIKGKRRSRFVNLYLGEVFLEAGQLKKAAMYFNKFIKDKKMKTEYKSVAKAELGLSYYMQGHKKKAGAVWSAVNAKHPEVLSSLSYAYSRVGLSRKKPVELSAKALKMERAQKRELSTRVLINAIGVFARAGMIDKGLDIAETVNLRSFSHEEVLGRNKVISFYSISLLNDLSLLYGKASLAYLKKASEDDKVGGIARYYLAEAFAFMGDVDQSVLITVSMHKAGKIPKQLSNNVKVREVANQYLRGEKSRAVDMLGELSNQKAATPDLLAEIIFTCTRLDIECNDVISRGYLIAGKGMGKRFSRINFALGGYFLQKKDYGKAVSFMEAGRDKGNKNRIENNDPLMLVSLAGAYYNTRKFSEALEIFFSMSKQFPPVRQIQVAMQGVYLMEQKSAGDVKIF